MHFASSGCKRNNRVARLGALHVAAFVVFEQEQICTGMHHGQPPAQGLGLTSGPTRLPFSWAGPCLLATVPLAHTDSHKRGPQGCKDTGSIGCIGLSEHEPSVDTFLVG